MSIANYNAASNNHAEILICIQSDGNLQEADFQAALEKINRHSKLIIADAGRIVHFRFEINSSPENSQWGFFQPHRRVMGLIMLARCTTAMDVALLHETFQKRKEAFADFIFDARCFVFGIENALYHQQSKTEVFQFLDVQSWKLSDNDIKEFLTSVFYVLESKRLQMAADKTDRPPLIKTPFEKNQSGASDSEGRSFRKKALGRWKKHLADVSLLAGLKMEALQNYQIALELLISANDEIWIGGVLESLCITSSIVLYPAESPAKSPVAKVAKQVLDPRNLIGSKLSGSLSHAELAKYCIDDPNDFIERYKEAVINYSRSDYMGIVELEACIKASKVMARMNKSMQAAEFLQNAVYIALKVSDEERIIKYSVLADLYSEINFHRKSAFYRRVAAMQCVAPQLEQPDWKKCYKLLLGTFVGYNLDLESDYGYPSLGNDKVFEFGWPQVRLRVLYELVFSARRNGNQKIANRILLYLLMRLHSYLTETEEKEACASLTAPSNRKDDSLSHSDEISLPPISLYNLPTIQHVSPQPLPDHLRPSVLNISQNKDSVFLFTPSSYQSAKSQRIDFKWCVGTPSEVRLQICNPLRVQTLHVTNMKLICKARKGAGRSMECHTVSVDIPPSSSTDIALVVTPLIVGTVVIVGYETFVFGVKSRCFFENMPWIPVDEFEADVTAQQPLLNRNAFYLTPNIKNRSNRLTMSLYPGEIRLLEIPFKNAGSVSVTHLDVRSMPPALANGTFVFKANSSSYKSKTKWLNVRCLATDEALPVDSNSSLSLPLEIETTDHDDEIMNDFHTCTCEVKVKYSGEEALKDNWCRSCLLTLTITLKPCINILSMSVSCTRKQDWSHFSLEISNVCDVTVVILSKKHQDLKHADNIEGTTIEGEESYAALATLEPDELKVINFEIRTMNPPQCFTKESVLLESWKTELSRTLNKNLGLKWKIKDETLVRRGNLDVSNYPLSNESITSLLRPPLHWEFYVDDKRRTDDRDPISVAVGQACQITVSMKNTTDNVIPIVELELEIFQDQQNGCREWNMEDCVVCVGCQCQSFPDVEPGEEVEFSCSLIFLLIGNFHVRLHRTPPYNDTLSHLWGGEMEGSSPSQALRDVFTFREYSPCIELNAE